MLRTGQFIGNMGADPVSKNVNNDTVVEFSIGVWKGKDKTLWVKVSAWGKLGEIVMAKGHKGAQVFVSGDQDVEVWLDKKTNEPRGQIKVTAHKFQVCGGNKEASDSAETGAQGEEAAQADGGADEVPF